MAYTIGEQYLIDRGGSIQSYHRYLAQGQRIGQAFFNSLSEKDQGRLRGHLLDPFYTHFNDDDLDKTIEFLLDTEDI